MRKLRRRQWKTQNDYLEFNFPYENKWIDILDVINCFDVNCRIIITRAVLFDKSIYIFI